MTTEETIQNNLIKAFPFLEGKITIQRARRMTLEVDQAHFREVFTHAIRKEGFIILCTITGLDEGDTIGAIYHLARENGVILNFKTSAPKANPVFETVTGDFPAATLYERELEDLLGVKVKGLPEGRRYPLPDDWPAGQYPLRKDWKADLPGLPEREGKHHG